MAIIFQENWPGTTLDTSKWTQTGGGLYVDNGKIAVDNSGQGYMVVSTNGKFTLTPTQQTTFEFSNSFVNSQADLALIINDIATGNVILAYCSENYSAMGLAIYANGIFGNGSWTQTGGTISPGTYYYKVVIDDTQITISQGPSYGDYSTRSVTRSLLTGIFGRNLYFDLYAERFDSAFYSLTVQSGSPTPTSNIASINGVPYADIKTINGVATADMKTFNGLS